MGANFWGALRRLLEAIEQALAWQCVETLDVGAATVSLLLGAAGDARHDTVALRQDGTYAPADLRAIWGRWAGRERAFYEAAAGIVESLSWREILERAGPQVRLRAGLVREAHARLRAPAVPEGPLRRSPFVATTVDSTAVRLTTYSNMDPITIPRALFDALPHFDETSRRTRHRRDRGCAGTRDRSRRRRSARRLPGARARAEDDGRRAGGLAGPGPQLGRCRGGRGRRAGGRCRGRGAPLRWSGKVLFPWRAALHAGRATLPDFEIPEADPPSRCRLRHGPLSLAGRVGRAVWYVPGTLGRGPGHVKPPPRHRTKRRRRFAVRWARYERDRQLRRVPALLAAGPQGDRRGARRRPPARAPAPWPPTTRTPRRSASRPARVGAARRRPACRRRRSYFATTAPAYLDKTNATAIHAALGLPTVRARAFDIVGSVRSAVGAMRAARDARGRALAVLTDIRTGLPGGADERDGGDAAAAFLFGDDAPSARARRAARRRRRRPRSSSTAGACPASRLARSGRSASASTPTCRSPRRPSTEALKQRRA